MTPRGATPLEFLTTTAGTASLRSRRRTPRQLLHVVTEWAVIFAAAAFGVWLAWRAITGLLVGVSVPFA